MKINVSFSKWLLLMACATVSLTRAVAETTDATVSLTPPPPATPRINGPAVFGVRPKSPLLYTIPATGERPMQFRAENLPAGLTLDPATGQITGAVKRKGEFLVTLGASNHLGVAEKKFRIVVGDAIALTPAMGWNSWNCWGTVVSQDKVLRSARALVKSGLADHGWTYINIDDGWQGTRAGKHHVLQANAKFPDLRQLCAEVHQLGLKAGIYSTPWITSYGNHAGGTSDSADGGWSHAITNGNRLGKYSFEPADARQWSEWGFDYLKYDWFPNDLPHVISMSRALRASGRDILFSLSNTAPFADASELLCWANSWRTSGDVFDQWTTPGKFWQFGVSEVGFVQDAWTPYAGPGHWNDPDMLAVGKVGWGTKQHPTQLTPDQQYSNLSLWCLLAAPLMIGCDLEQLDPFTFGLLSNDEVLAVDQDELGKQAARVAVVGAVDVYLKPLADGGRAMGFFNRAPVEQSIAFDKFKSIGFTQPQHVRDLWRQADLPDLPGLTDPNKLRMTIPGYGVKLYKLTDIK